MPDSEEEEDLQESIHIRQDEVQGSKVLDTGIKEEAFAFAAVRYEDGNHDDLSGTNPDGLSGHGKGFPGMDIDDEGEHLQENRDALERNVITEIDELQEDHYRSQHRLAVGATDLKEDREKARDKIIQHEEANEADERQDHASKHETNFGAVVSPTGDHFLQLSNTSPPNTAESPTGRPLPVPSVVLEGHTRSLSSIEDSARIDEEEGLLNADDFAESPLPQIRNFRPRKAIQLHPFAIEGEKYRKTLHNHGMKALRVARGEPSATNEADAQSSDPEGSHFSGSSSPGAALSPTVSASNDADVAHNEDEEFPDMDVLLRRQDAQFMSRGYKRRRIDRPRFRPPPGFAGRFPPTPLHNHPSPSTSPAQIYINPLSPPLSSSPTRTAVDSSKRPNERTSALLSNALPTPADSSEPKAPLLRRLPGQPPGETHTGLDIDESSDSSSANSTVEADPILHAQRRIRGVLPASWLKLDIKAQGAASKPSKRLYANDSPEKRTSIKGVAHHVVKPTRLLQNQGTSKAEPFSILDESSSEEDKGTSSGNVSRFQTNGADVASFSRLGEAEETDEVDAMLPAASRAPYKWRSKKRQTKLLDFEVKKTRSGERVTKPRPRKSSPLRSRRSIGSHQVFKAFRIPKLSILDLDPDNDVREQTQTPRFLKVARRTIRSRRDKGRHRPTHKYIQLATPLDTRDANTSLSRWKMGAITPKVSKRTVRSQLRQPLLPLADGGNASLKSLQPSRPKAVSQCPRTTRREGTQKPRKVQSSLELIKGGLRRQSAAADPGANARSNQVGSMRQGNKGQITSDLAFTNDARPALLESTEQAENSIRPDKALRRLLQIGHRTPHQISSSGPVWDQFFEAIGIHESRALNSPHESHEKDAPKAGIHDKTSHQQRRTCRKRQPHRVDLSLTWQKQLDADPSVSEATTGHSERALADCSSNRLAQQSSSVLKGLSPFGTSYTFTFNVIPFPQGAAFHESTFLGSGSLKRTLLLSETDLDCHRGTAVFTVMQDAFQWGPWNETVSTEANSLVEKLTQIFKTNASLGVLRQGIEIQHRLCEYFSVHLSFLDPIDRLSFLQRCAAWLQDVDLAIRARAASNAEDSSAHEEDERLVLKAAKVHMVLYHHLYQISRHHVVPSTTQHDFLARLSECTMLLGSMIRERFSDIEGLSGQFRRVSDADLVIRNSETLEALIVARHLVASHALLHDKFWTGLLEPNVIFNIRQDVEIQALEPGWRRLFTMLPLLEFDSQGVLHAGRRFGEAFNTWAYVKTLMNPVLAVYLANMAGQGPSFNGYLRALFNRCLRLLNDWGWRQCDLIIGVLFDFFARNHLNHLIHEESHGSPDFLDNLSPSIYLSPEPEDRCFHLLLKVIGSGIRHMRQLLPERKIRDLIWRLMPNHGRSHPKDQAIRQADLNALRNHHDLLCTLYWASPPICRPRISVLRDLVHVEQSHKEACHINIRAWSYLARFQLLTDEPLSCLDPFIEWHDDFIQQLVRQHQLARTEAEEQVRSVQTAQGVAIPQRHLESTIANNQRQVEAIICDAVASLRRAVQTASSKEKADKLLSGNLGSIFRIFDAARPQSQSPIMEVLVTLASYAEKHKKDWSVTESLENDDSQDYGGWPDLEEAGIGLPEPISSPLLALHDVLRRFLSNCFGADLAPSDVLLCKAVDVWVVLSEVLVRSGAKMWSDYINSYGSDSWSNLRYTDQTRKYTPYYLATVVETCQSILLEDMAYFLQLWLEAVVERESLLKYQHKLTSAVLNAGMADELLSNLPFARARFSGRFEINARDFQERRLSSISTVLCNMRSAVGRAQKSKTAAEAHHLKQEYKELLRHMMSTMKRNYQELGQASNVQGNYVDFIHRVVEFLQQYTADICPIDRFFTDNTSFPLPAKDPTYVVGQLRNYALRLQEARAPQELAVFLQSVSERAATDGQQIYLENQLSAAMTAIHEDGSSLPSLRSFIVSAILPAYTQQALRTTCGWILVMPFLHCLKEVFGGLLHDFDGCQIQSTKAIADTLTAYLRSIRGSLATVCTHPILIEKAPTLKTIRAYYEPVIKLLPTLDYLMRLEIVDEAVVEDVHMLEQFAATFLRMTQREDPNNVMVDLQKLDEGVQSLDYAELRAFTGNELRQTLEKNWTCRDGNFFASRGSARRQIVVDVGLVEEEKADLVKVLQDFLRTLAQLPSWNPEGDATGRSLSGLEGLTI